MRTTSHHEIVAGEAARGVARAGQITGIPCPLGIVTAESLDQAVERAGGKQGNRGWDAAMAALEMVNLLPSLDERRGGPDEASEPRQRKQTVKDGETAENGGRTPGRKRPGAPWAPQEEVR